MKSRKGAGVRGSNEVKKHQESSGVSQANDNGRPQSRIDSN